MTAKKEILLWAEEQLKDSGIADWKIDAFLLYEYVTGENRMCFLMNSRETMKHEHIILFKDLVKKRCEHIPLQYLTNTQEFMGYDFYVNEHVLIPRMDTEVLVLEVEKYLKKQQRIENLLLDMCTGSGCIAISLKKRNEKLNVTAVDISQQALEVAEKNSENLQADVHFIKSDLFEQFKLLQQNKQNEKLQKNIQFDIVVSNPPYIPTEVVNGLDEEVRCHEPRLALDGTKDGLEFYRRITKECLRFLKDGGMLFYEIGHDQGEAVRRIMEQAGFDNVEIIKDLAGLDRVVYGGKKYV